MKFIWEFYFRKTNFYKMNRIVVRVCLQKNVIFKNFLILLIAKHDTCVMFYKKYNDFINTPCYYVCIGQLSDEPENTE